MAPKLGKLFNGEGELIAEGLCEFNNSPEGGMDGTMSPPAERALFDRQRGLLTLFLEDGAALWISDRRLKLNVSPPGGVRTSVYRMRVVQQGQREGGYHTFN